MQYFKNFELKNYTSFKIGGKATEVYFPETTEEFVEILKTLKNHIGSLTSMMQICTFLKGLTFARHGYLARSGANYVKWPHHGSLNPNIYIKTAQNNKYLVTM